MITDFFRIGLFVRPHGVRGELKMLSLTDDPKRFSRLRDAFIETADNSYKPVMVQSAKVTGDGFVIVGIEGVTSMDEAETMRNKYLCVDRAHAVKLPEGSYFVKDLIGCSVSGSDGALIGTFDDVYETNANDVYVVKCVDGSKLSFPALKKLLVSVDVENKCIVVDSQVLMEVGLVEN